MTCLRCGEPIVGRRSHAQLRYCSVACRTLASNTRKRERNQDRIAELRHKRPRCVICSGPIRYGSKGVNDLTTTCSRRCAYTRHNWFVARRRRAA